MKILRSQVIVACWRAGASLLKLKHFLCRCELHPGVWATWRDNFHCKSSTEYYQFQFQGLKSKRAGMPLAQQCQCYNPDINLLRQLAGWCRQVVASCGLHHDSSPIFLSGANVKAAWKGESDCCLTWSPFKTCLSVRSWFHAQIVMHRAAQEGIYKESFPEFESTGVFCKW